MKRIKELNKVEKTALLAAISNGEIDRKQLTHDTFVCIKKTDWYFGMQESITMEEKSLKANVVYIGEAKEIYNEMQLLSQN